MLAGGEVISDEGKFSANGAVTLMPARRVLDDKTSRGANGSRKWEWVAFRNAARNDDLKLFHWQKVGVEVVEYPYAAFNVRLERIEYTEQEYDKHLKDPLWTMADTDHLMDLCYQLDLRWPVIADRYLPVPTRPLEQLQARYYFVAHTLCELRKSSSGPDIASLGINSRSADFDVQYEEKRRRQLHAAFCRTRSEEAEERALREELKAVELESRRLKKSAKQHAEMRRATVAAQQHIQPQKAPDTHHSQPAQAHAHLSAASSGNQARARESPAAHSRVALAGSNPADATARSGHLVATRRPLPGQPYLQSARLRVPDPPAGLSKGMLRKLALVLDELGIPPRPMPTKLVCDAYDALRRDVVLLLSMQKLANTKQAELSQLRKHLDDTASSSRNTVIIGAHHAKAQQPQAPAPSSSQQSLHAQAKVQMQGQTQLFHPPAAAKQSKPMSGSQKRKNVQQLAASANCPAEDQFSRSHKRGRKNQ